MSESGAESAKITDIMYTRLSEKEGLSMFSEFILFITSFNNMAIKFLIEKLKLLILRKI